MISRLLFLSSLRGSFPDYIIGEALITIGVETISIAQVTADDSNITIPSTISIKAHFVLRFEATDTMATTITKAAATATTAIDIAFVVLVTSIVHSLSGSYLPHYPFQ